MNGDLVTPSMFFQAFSQAWHGRYSGANKDQIDQLYKDSKPWSKFLLGDTKESIDSPKSLFGETANILRNHFGDIKAIRREDYKIDMMIVGGECCPPWAEHWGYASRCMVMIEHENDMTRCHEELYNLIVRRGELKVLAFPQWRDQAGKSQVNSDRPKKAVAQKFEEVLRNLRGVYETMNSPRDVMLLVSRRTNDNRIVWKYAAGVPATPDGFSREITTSS